jgi:hypothetical protein
VKIKNTDVDATCPWPDTIQLIQGGSSGLVIRALSKGGNYGTAFVEVFSPEGGFIRGEGPTVADAEQAAWVKYSTRAACPGHEYEARGYKNGAGFCKTCNKFESDVFTAEQLGLCCKTCGVPTKWSRVGDDFFCEVHADDPETRSLKRQRLKETASTEETVTGSKLGDFFELRFLEEEDG